MLTDRQTNKQTRAKTFPSSFVGGNKQASYLYTYRIGIQKCLFKFDNFYRAMLCVPRTMLSQDVCPSVSLSVCLSICLSHAGILSKRFNISSHFFTFYRNIPTGTPITGPLNAGGYEKAQFSINISVAISQKRYKIQQ